MTRYHLLLALAFALGLALPAVALWGHEPEAAEGPMRWRENCVAKCTVEVRR